jgi:hypothetical protein
MKRRLIVLSLALGLSVALMIPAGAADLHEPHTNMTFDCDGIVSLHFVNNQTGGAAAADITVMLNGGGTTISDGPTKVKQNVQHYDVDIAGTDTLTDATTGALPGMLVLSDWECVHDKKK